MRRAFLALTVLVLASAGCLGGDGATDDGVTPAAANSTVQIGDRPDPSFSALATDALGSIAAPDAEATLLEAPKLRVGEWWRIKMWSPLDGREAEYVRVLAAIDGDTYVMGMPHEGWYKEAVVYHVPFFGDVGMDLSGRAHNVLFTPLQFPLTDGATWTTQFEGPPELTALVDADEAAKTATVTFTQPNGAVALTLVYDAKVHEIVKFEQATIHYEVLEHGYDFEGWVTVPRGEDLVFFHGRIGGAVGVSPAGIAPAAPVETVEIAGGFNRMSFILLVGGSVAPEGAGSEAGTYRERAVGPDGTEYVLQSLPGEPGYKVAFFEARDPDGTWNLEHLAAGPGIAFIEGIAYHQYDIKVPTGERRADHSHEVIR